MCSRSRILASPNGRVLRPPKKKDDQNLTQLLRIKGQNLLRYGLSLDLTEAYKIARGFCLIVLILPRSTLRTWVVLQICTYTEKYAKLPLSCEREYNGSHSCAVSLLSERAGDQGRQDRHRQTTLSLPQS